MEIKPIRVAVTGAAGQVAYSLLFRLASGEAFGPHQPIILQLLEIPPAMGALEGVIMELQDCAFPLLYAIEASDDAKTAFTDVNWALLVGSRPRSKGMQRSELIDINAPIFVEQGQALNSRAAEDIRILVVGNPCNTNCLVAAANAKAIPKDRWFAMTRLDENRAKAQLAKRSRAPVSKVTNLALWGNHSSKQYSDYENARINGRPVLEIIADETWLEGEFQRINGGRGAAIIQARGVSSAASAANAALNTLQSLNLPSSTNDWHSAAIISDDNPYGIVSNLFYSFPLRTGKDGQVRCVEGLSLSANARRRLQENEAELLEERASVAHLLL